MEKIGLLSLSCFWPKEQVFVGPKTLLLALCGSFEGKKIGDFPLSTPITEKNPLRVFDGFP